MQSYAGVCVLSSVTLVSRLVMLTKESMATNASSLSHAGNVSHKSRRLSAFVSELLKFPMMMLQVVGIFRLVFHRRLPHAFESL